MYSVVVLGVNPTINVWFPPAGMLTGNVSFRADEKLPLLKLIWEMTRGEMA